MNTHHSEKACIIKARCTLHFLDETTTYVFDNLCIFIGSKEQFEKKDTYLGCCSSDFCVLSEGEIPSHHNLKNITPNELEDWFQVRVSTSYQVVPRNAVGTITWDVKVTCP